MIKELALFAASIVLPAVLLQPANARPPAVGSEDYMLMAPFADEIRKLYMNGVWCCDWSDGRPVDARRADNESGWQVRFKTSNDVDAPADQWIDVPKEAIDRDAPPNPTGVPIAWWVFNRVRCFWPGLEG